MEWHQIHGWFQWRSAQEEAIMHFPEQSIFLEVGNYLGRSLCSLAELTKIHNKKFSLIGVDTCLGSGPEGLLQKNYHQAAVDHGGGTFAGTLHKNIIDCGFANDITLIITDSLTSAKLITDETLDWVHLDARHDYEGLIEDITTWLPKIKKGGWISGDDYNQSKWPSVVQAVSELLPEATTWSIDQWRFIKS